MVISKYNFRNSILVLFVFFLFNEAQSQVGVNGRYLKPNLNNNGEESIITSGYGIGLDYWFRLKTKRIEFMPEIGYENYNLEIEQLKMSSFYFMFKTNFYLLNFNEDCNCPTFSKEGNTISKGFYISIAPLVKSFSLKSDVTENEIVGGVVLGAGLDIGITELFTITPNIGYEITSNINDGEYKALQLGLRAGLRFNDGKKKFRR